MSLTLFILVSHIVLLKSIDEIWLIYLYLSNFRALEEIQIITGTNTKCSMLSSSLFLNANECQYWSYTLKQFQILYYLLYLPKLIIIFFVCSHKLPNCKGATLKRNATNSCKKSSKKSNSLCNCKLKIWKIFLDICPI